VVSFFRGTNGIDYRLILERQIDRFRLEYTDYIIPQPSERDAEPSPARPDSVWIYYVLEHLDGSSIRSVMSLYIASDQAT